MQKLQSRVAEQMFEVDARCIDSVSLICIPYHRVNNEEQNV